MLNTHTTGRFSYHNKGCTVIHHIPQGKTHEGYPVIVFPQKDTQVVEGRLYSFSVRMTMSATYVVENSGRKTIFRVGHATMLMPAEGEEGDIVDSIVHRSSGSRIDNSLGASLSDDVRQKLMELVGT